MSRALVCLAGLLLFGQASATPWVFGERVAVTGAHGPGIFHHVESAGRRNVAAQHGTVVVAWEDNRDGAPQVYVAFKAPAAEAFAEAMRVSTGTEAFEPAVAGVGKGAFLVAWEQDGQVWLRVVRPAGIGPPQGPLEGATRQVTLAAGGDGVAHVAWVQAKDGGHRLLHARATVSADQVRLDGERAVDPTASPLFQAYPALAALDGNAVLIAWEDRRHGHTRIYAARRDEDGPFSPPQEINEFRAAQRAPESDGKAGLGSGAMRVGLALAGDGRAFAVWLDKRDPGSGYAVWGAFGDEHGRFGRNLKVQDDAGGSAAVPHWHVSAGSYSERVAVVWEDARESWADPDETGDVWLSWTSGGEWSGDHRVPPASGPGRQGSPAFTFDGSGNLHLVWTEQPTLSGPSRLWYARGLPAVAPLPIGHAVQENPL